MLGEVEQTDVHVSDGLDWLGRLKAFGELTEKQLDPERAVWRLRIFVGVHGVPASSPGQPSTVAVLQMSHAFADGARAAALAGLLFGRNVPLPAIAAPPAERRVSRGIKAIRRRRQLDFEIEAGQVPAPAGPVPALRTNNAATGAPILRTFVRHRTQLPGKSITVGALVVISEALGGYLRERGEDPSTLTALVPMAKSGIPHARNHSGPEYIRLHPDVRARDERAGLIANEFETVGYPFLTPNIGLTHGVHGGGDMVAISVNTTESIIPDTDHYIDRLTASQARSEEDRLPATTG